MFCTSSRKMYDPSTSPTFDSTASMRSRKVSISMLASSRLTKNILSSGMLESLSSSMNIPMRVDFPHLRIPVNTLMKSEPRDSRMRDK